MTTTLDPSNKDALVALTGSNLIMTGSGMTGTNNDRRAYSVATIGASDKVEFEIVLGNTSGTQSQGVGVSTSATGTHQFAGGGTNDFGSTNFDIIRINGSTVGNVSGGSGSATDVYRVAIDLTNNLGWIKRNANNYNNTVGAAPGGTGGISISGITGTLLAYGVVGQNADSLTFRFLASSFTLGALHSGFTELGTTSNANATGSTVTDTASIVAGTASAGVSLSGVTISDTASIVAGTATAGTGAGATGATITDTASIIAGTAQLSVQASGATITDTASIVAGAPFIDVQAQGVTMTLVASLIAGTASSGQINVIANGQLITVPASIVSGHAYIGARTLTNQELRQLAARNVTGKALDYNGDWEALFDAAGIATNLDLDGRMLAWINQKLAANYTDLDGALVAFANANGADSWNSLGTFI